MADNVGYTPGTGALVAADDIGGVLHQRIKIGVGGDGTAVDVSSANPMPITAPSALSVTGSVGITTSSPIDVQGTVSVGNFPATQNVNIVGGSSGNAAASATGAAVPASADYMGFNSGGNLVGVSSSNPLPVNIGAAGTLAVTDANAELLLTRMLNYLNAPQGYDKSLQAMRITGTLPTVTTVGTVTTVTTVTTCSTVTNLSTIDTLQGRIQVYGQNLAAWASTVRARIT